ncbi:ATP-dependent helicase HrpB [Streptomyces sp. SPB074]|uniref:ATP-dependent helicase HrpB n=1 Tax=Streptomyces sp. (strain SPB074) TaxID=465543 RepID=UPI00017F2495|nr:ATP-dependent helicase HrpB [Streptomyces sp. SPB074]
MIRTAALDALPVRTALPALAAALYGPGAGGTAVLTAPPGSGKTTLVPLALAGLLGDQAPARRVLVAEPRRIAVRAAARRMAWLLGEEVGEHVGFRVRGERRTGPRTRVEVVTTGVLLQRLQRDQELAGVDVVILDECHERHLDADTATAFLLDVRAALRPELRLLAASATTDAQGWARLLGGAPVVGAEGVSYPVETVWVPPRRPFRPPLGLRVDPAQLQHVAAVVRQALAERSGDVLCFLPGVGEIAKVAGLLAGEPDLDVLQVHGRAPAETQDAVLAGPGARRRVVLATSVAESSLTVPGVRVVVDAGLAREPRVDHARGLAALTTVRASLAAAAQRAGRAGREAPGTAYRCWDRAEEHRMAAFPAPEIAVADLTAFALQAACWGDPDASSLALLDPPPAGALAAARAVLTALGATGADGRATERGERLARLGLHPRLGRALLGGAAEAGGRLTAELVALLSEEPPRAYGDDLALVLRRARQGGDGYGGRWRQEVRRLRGALRQAGVADGDGALLPEDAAAGVVTALAHPERVARARGGGFLMVSGTGAEPERDSRLREAPWLAVAVADRPAGAASARVRLAAAIDERTAREAAAPLYAEGQEVRWADGDVRAREVTRLGAVVLRERNLARPASALVRDALRDGLAETQLGLLEWTRGARELRARMAFVREVRGEPWADVSDAALLARAEDWLEPELSRARRRADLGRVKVAEALRRLLPWASGEAGRFGELVPESVELPDGRRVRLAYPEGGGGESPVLAARVQQLFGLRETPRVAGVPVRVHLLSPAGRPAAVTSDLESFWAEGYRAVRADLRGRYPKHAWPERP